MTFVEANDFPPLRPCTHDELKWGRKKEYIGGREITVCGRCREEITPTYRKGYQFVFTELETDVVESVLETALNGWEGDPRRQVAAQRVLGKLTRRA